MKILILTEFFAPAWAFGGPPRALFGIARELVKRQHSVTVIATNVLDSRNEIEETYNVLEGVKVHYLKTLSPWLAWNQKIFLTMGFRKLLKEKIEDFDIIVLASFRTIFGFISYSQARAFNKPYILLPYGDLPRGKGFKKILKGVLDPIFGYRMLGDASFVFAQTDHEMQEAAKYGAKKPLIKLVPLNVDLSEFENLPPRGVFRRKFGIKDEEKVILFLGRLHEYKGIELLIKSFFHLTQIKGNCRLVIVGRDDGYLSSMLRLIKSLRLEGKVIFAGSLYGKDRIIAYVDADVFVMPSRYESFGNTILEAWACGTPVIVTKNCAISDIIGSSNAGGIVEFELSQIGRAHV